MRTQLGFCEKYNKNKKKMQPQRFPGQGPPMRPYQQQGYPPGPRPGGYPGQQMGPGGPQRMGVPPHGGMPPHPYAGMRPGMSPGMPPPPGPPGMQGPMDRKRPPDPRAAQHMKTKKKKKVADKILPQRVRDLVPESQAYMDLLAFERKLDTTIMRKRLDIQEALKRPMKQKRKLRIFISNTFYPVKAEGEDGEESVASWELRVEGRLLEDSMSAKLGSDPAKVKRKFSSFFKSLVIELDKDLYGPDNHLVEWHRTPTTQETDGFQVKRPGDQNVKCTVLLMLDYQPPQFKLDQRLARLLGVHTQTRPVIINALWQYIKTHKLQDPHEREFINCDKYLEQIFDSSRMKFAEIPGKLHSLLMPPDPIVINHVIVVEGPDSRKTACYDIEVEVDDTLKQQMNSFLLSTQSQQEIASLDSKVLVKLMSTGFNLTEIHETVETINQLKTNREFFLSFAKDPQEFINNWLISQTRDLKTITDVAGNPEEERRADYYYKPWSQEAVCRYFYGKVQQRRMELEQALGIRNT
ncbi:SWI/SNF-related matrix-associated actin-dependent regulator of chromatin subfamily D member 1-like isoform X4 [Mizuhopecten yessoensis]|uniref:SWI/SNF-related matrix-associated actin-dependent regulator of chromatin subfamily D member 1-like isoform X4 n=1 Tax=Mizuhopecten yessoensis TaxID=6573 RepID=UPI000B45ED65|nr:SWI/SNF-related matrix-associated actin-dependent regulator of chromatin subfamily D member 1-like isoform X4 [Mizuhopecten yessoensis]